MSDFKSKLPDLKELTSMGEKLFKGLKSSVTEIIDDYKKKRESMAEEESIKSEEKPAEAAKPAVKAVKEKEKPTVEAEKEESPKE